MSSGGNIQPGEGKNILLLMLSLFFLLITVYLLKPVKEVLILTSGSPEERSYTVALQVIVLLVLLPIYGAFSRKFNSHKFMIAVAIFFILNLFCFAVLGSLGYDYAVVFFVWLGAFGVLMVSQFWAFISQVYDAKTGERLFALIALGASVGGWVGAALARYLFQYFNVNEVIFISIFPLLISVLFTFNINSQGNDSDAKEGLLDSPIEKKVSLLSGFSLISKNNYLLLIAIFVILLNWCSSTGDYIMAVIVDRFYEDGVKLGSLQATKEEYIGKFYSEFYFWVNLVGIFIQFFLVSRLIKWLGFNVAFILTPILIVMGYGALSFLPIISLFRVIKISENGLNYSLQSTTLQILYLPTTRREKYEARAAIDTVCWKVGDLLQAASIFLGITYLQLLPRHFVFLNITLAIIMVILAYYIGKMYQEKIRSKQLGNTKYTDEVAEKAIESNSSVIDKTSTMLN